MFSWPKLHFYFDKKVFQISQITCKNCNNYCVINQCCNNDIILMTWFFWKVHWIIGENSQFFNLSEYFPACKKHFCCYSLFTFLWMNISLCISCNLWLFFLRSLHVTKAPTVHVCPDVILLKRYLPKSSFQVQFRWTYGLLAVT